LLNQIITLTTDFGRDGRYVAAMKGVILSINPAATIVDISHSVAPQNIAEGAFVLGESSCWFPPESIHVAVVDPGVGTARRIIYARVGNQQYVGPDNGLLSYVCRNREPDAAFEITNRSLFLPQVSNTFHGRDIMAPVAAHLSLGLPPEQLGASVDTLNLLAWPRAERQADSVTGHIVWSDRFGNLITDIGRADLPDDIDHSTISIHIGRHKLTGIVRTYSDGQPHTAVALFGSNGLLEVAIVQGNAASDLHLGTRDRVVVSW
jgi:S-adenosylmethionine hydrolase